MSNAEALGHVVVATLAGYMMLHGGFMVLAGLATLGGWIALTSGRRKK